MALVLSLFSTWIFAAAVGNPVLVSSTVGEVDGPVYTSRDLKLFYYLKGQKTVDSQSAQWVAYIDNFLIELAEIREGELFNLLSEVDTKKIDGIDKMKKMPGFADENYSIAEIQKMAAMEKRAAQMTEIKADTLKRDISDNEAKDYFEKNRAKFDQFGFEKFKDNIKTFLQQQELELKLSAWREILKKKYKVKNYFDLAK